MVHNSQILVLHLIIMKMKNLSKTVSDLRTASNYTITVKDVAKQLKVKPSRIKRIFLRQDWFLHQDYELEGRRHEAYLQDRYY